MAHRIPPHIPALLSRLQSENALRTLPQQRHGAESLVDFTSNDYLGLARAPFPVGLGEIDPGATGSRLLSGNHPAHEAFEKQAAAFFQGPAALLFNSGYLANLGIISSLPSRGDTILYDERSHASIKDAIRLAHAKRHAFKHNDWSDLERLLKQAAGTVWIVAEGLYSMDGDQPDMEKLVGLAKLHGAFVILDEAHSTGVYGAGGRGIAVQEKVENEVLVRIHTFGKAVGYHGAVAIVPEPVREFLVNRSRPFIYTTAMPPAACHILQEKLAQMAAADEERRTLSTLHGILSEALDLPQNHLFTPIVPVLQPGNDHVKQLALHLCEAGFDVRPILSPTVPIGQERLRIVLHSFNTPGQVRQLAQTIRSNPDN